MKATRISIPLIATVLFTAGLPLLNIAFAGGISNAICVFTGKSLDCNSLGDAGCDALYETYGAEFCNGVAAKCNSCNNPIEIPEMICVEGVEGCVCYDNGDIVDCGGLTPLMKGVCDGGDKCDCHNPTPQGTCPKQLEAFECTGYDCF